MARRIIVHGLLQKARRDAEKLLDRQRFDTEGKLWRRSRYNWEPTDDQLSDPDDREDFLVGKLTQEDR